MNIDNTLIQKYAPTLFSAAVTVFGGLQVLVSSGHGLVEILQFLTLLVTTVTTYLVPLVDARWRGAWKTGLELVGVVVAAVLPFAIAHTLTWANALLIAVALVKALATHFGVTLRTDTAIDAGTANAAAPAIITTLPAAALPTTDAIVAGDDLSNPANALVPDSDEPKHAAS